MNGLRVLPKIALFAAMVSGCHGQVQSTCFAFLLRGDVALHCEGRNTQITHRGNIEAFAISNERSAFSYTTSQITERDATTQRSISTTAVTDLKAGTSKSIERALGIVSTCGGLLTVEARSIPSGPRDLITGEAVALPPYVRFRCSSDRKTVIGITKEQGSDLWKGIPPNVRVAMAGGFSMHAYSISVDGTKIAYQNNRDGVCLFASSGPAVCVEKQGTVTDIPSVNNFGEVLVAAGTGKECFYNGPYNFSAERFRGATDENKDECLGIGYWKPGLKAIEIIEPLGRNPQWINSPTAALLRDWSLHQTGDVH